MNKEDFFYYILARRGELLEACRYTTDKNNIIETPIGYFRSATFLKGGKSYLALFNTRQYDDLAATEDGSILYPERLNLVEIFPLNPADLLENNFSGHQTDERRWLLSQFQVGLTIHRKVIEHSRALYREAVLHRYGSTTWKSAFVGFALSKLGIDLDRYKISVVTENHNPFRPVKMENIVRAFNAAGKMTSQRINGIPLTTEEVATDSAAGKSTKSHKVTHDFTMKKAKSLMMARFGFALHRLWNGQDPHAPTEKGGWRVYPTRALYAANEKVTQFIHDKHKIVKIILLATELSELLDFFPYLARLMTKTAGHFISDPGTYPVPEACNDLVARQFVLFRNDASLYKSFVPFKPERLVDYNMKWVPPQDQCKLNLGLHFTHDPAYTSSSEDALGEAQRFHQWVRTNYHGPQNGIVEYIGAQGEFINPENSDPNNPDYAVIHGEFSNGVELYHDITSDRLYAYYKTPAYTPENRKLPLSTGTLFQEERVWSYDLRDPYLEPLSMSFEQFQNRIDDVLGKGSSLEFPIPEKPPLEMLNEARTAKMNATQPLARTAISLAKNFRKEVDVT